MVVIPKKFHLIKVAQRRELFTQTCGPLILRLGNGTRFISYSFLLLFLVFTISYGGKKE